MSDSQRYLMEEMTWQEVKDAAANGWPAVVVLGSTEQHGPHLPLNTDAIIPVEIALKAGASMPLVIAPPIHYGAMSRPLIGGGESFPGTVSLRAATFISTVKEVLLGLAKSGFRDLVRRDRIADDRATRAPDWDVVPAPADFITSSGVLMRPTDANEESGRRFLEASARRLVTAIRTEFG